MKKKNVSASLVLQGEATDRLDKEETLEGAAEERNSSEGCLDDDEDEEDDIKDTKDQGLLSSSSGSSIEGARDDIDEDEPFESEASSCASDGDGRDAANGGHTGKLKLKKGEAKNVFQLILPHDYDKLKRDEAGRADPSEDLSRRELGGLLVYDSYARMNGCTKILDY